MKYKILCRLGVHDWLPWENLEPSVPIMNHLHQISYCLHCHKARRRWVA
jgi:hypothetical protein